MSSHHRIYIVSLITIIATAACAGSEQETPAASSGGNDARSQLIARAASYELDTEYVPPPGEALHHHTAGFARTLLSLIHI